MNSNNTKLCCGSFLVIIVLFFLIVYLKETATFLFFLFLGYLLYKGIKRKKRISKLKKDAENEIEKLFDIVSKTKDKNIKNLYEKTINFFTKGKFTEGFECINSLKSLINEKEEATKKLAKIRFEKNQLAKGLLKFVDKNGNEKYGTPKQVKEWKELDIGLNNNFKNLSPFEFEEFVAKLFNKMGYHTKLGSRVRDFGIDILVKKGNENVVIQCKKNTLGNLVGNKIIQQTLGAMWKAKANRAIIITTSDYTTMAREQAKGAPIELWNKEDLHKMIRKYFVIN